MKQKLAGIRPSQTVQPITRYIIYFVTNGYAQRPLVERWLLCYFYFMGNTAKAGVVLGIILTFGFALTAAAYGSHNQYSNRGNQGYGNHQGSGSNSGHGSSTGSGPTSGNGNGGTVGGSTPPTAPPVVTGNEVIITNAYTTAYGWPDNTPAGANTTIMGVSGTAGGTGTYASPITMATGFSLAGGKETDDYAAGTIFYDPNLRKYFVIGDTCGDGSSPQTESCHVSEIPGTIQLDMWIGGQGANSASVLACEDAVTRVGTLIENPPSNLAVVAGPVFNGTCATQYGDTVI